MPEQLQAITVLAFDFGLRRIGVAIGQTVTASASPLGAVRNRLAGPDFLQIEALIREWQPDRLIVGLPLQADGSEGDVSKHVRQFIADLDRFGLPVGTFDERHTSQEAEAALKRARQAGTHSRIQKQDIDAAAAVLIAERYLGNL